MTKKIRVWHTFLNEKGEVKKVDFYIDSLLYKDILTLPENEKSYWLKHYYHEYCQDQYINKKEYKNCDHFVDSTQEEQEEDEILVSKKKFQQISDSSCDEQAIFNTLIVNQTLELLNEDEKYAFEQVHRYKRKIVNVAVDMKIDESTVRKKIRKAIKKINDNYNF